MSEFDGNWLAMPTIGGGTGMELPGMKNFVPGCTQNNVEPNYANI